MTADLMHTINRRQEWIAQCAEARVQAARMLTLAEVTTGIASPDYRRARLDIRKLDLAIGQCSYDLEFAREQLARLCEPWFLLEVCP